MKNKTIFSAIVFSIASLTIASAQSKNYVQGTLHASNQKLTGYFWLTDGLAYGGQRIYYKASQETDRQVLSARNFESFETSDSYYEQFDVAHAQASGGIAVLLPRLEKGKINLFKYNYVVTNSKHKFNRENKYYVRKGIARSLITYNNFGEKMEELLNDNPELLKKIRSKELGYYDLREIVSEYNQNVGSRTNDSQSLE